MKVKYFITFLFILICLQVSAWGPTGHRATGWIAEKYLNKKARKAVNSILEGQSIAMASTWMDEIRSDSLYDFMTDWHWVTIPEGMTYEQTLKNPNGDIIQTLERVIAEVKRGGLTPKQQAENLKILIHLVGDIHQPLHVGALDDRGGNDVLVSWFRAQSNLHRVWDSDMIDDTRLSYTELAQSLERPTDDQIRSWQNDPVITWANESQSFQKDVYDVANGRLGYEYSYRNFRIVRLRLLQAGVRLAGILNQIYG